MTLEKKFIVGIMADFGEPTKVYYKRSNPAQSDADFTFLCSQSKHFDDKFVAQSVAERLKEFGYDAFVEDFLSFSFGN